MQEVCTTSYLTVCGARCYYLNVVIVVPTVTRALLRNMEVYLEVNKIRELLKERKFPKGQIQSLQ